MKKTTLIACLACVFAATAVSARQTHDDRRDDTHESRFWTPIGLSILTPPVQLPSPSHSVFGAMLNLGYGQLDNLTLLDVGVVNNVTDNMVGLEVGAVNRFEVWKEGEKLGVAELPQPGRHNILNALAAIGVAIACDIPFEAIQKGLAGFGGVGRRFEFKGERNGVTVIDDYGHHPREIQATLDTARRVFPDRRIVVAFQPHRFTRTQAHFAEFCKLFDNVGEVLLTEIYAASEKPIPGITGQNLAQGMRQVSSTPVTFYQTVPELVQGLEEKLKPGDVLMTIGAGSITKAGPAWLEGGRHA